MDRNEIENIVEESLFSPEDLELAYGPDHPLMKAIRKKKVILLIDDDFYIRTFLSEILKNDFEVLMAEDGEKGCEMARKCDPDLILLDLMMPKVDGKTTLKRLRVHSLTKNVPVIIVSGSNKSEVSLELAQTGIKEFIQKPVRPREFLSTVKSSLGQSKNGDETVEKSALIQIDSQEKAAIWVYEAENSKLQQIRGNFEKHGLMTVECGTLKQFRQGFKRHCAIFEGVIYDSGNSELQGSFDIREVCEFLEIPCFSVREYLKSPEAFQKKVQELSAKRKKHYPG